VINPFIAVINNFLPEPQAGLVNGILFGVRSQFSKDFYEALITTGTVHIVALSGQNISILIQAVSQMTLIFSRKISILLTIAAIVGFVWFVGIDPPVVRAAIMGSLTLIATYFGRRNISLLGLIFSALIMLIVYPAWAFEVSFQLSFLASLGIILFGRFQQISEAMSLRKQVQTEITNSFRTTIAAQLATLPVLILVFRQISLVAPLSNVLISATITPIMGLGFLLGVIGLLLPFLAPVFASLVWVPTTFLYLVVTLTAQIPFAAFNF